MTTVQAQSPDHRPPSPSPSQLPPVPPSPTFSHASTANPLPGGPPNMNMSTYSLPLPPPPPPTAHAVLTKNDLAASQQAYAELLSTAKSYRVALAALSTAASAFGSALESCARLKEARADSLNLSASVSGHGATTSGGCTADSLLSAAGVHHLVANHEQILSETVYRSFEVPLLHELDKWRRSVEDEEAAYLADVRRQSADIRRLEKEGMRLHRQRGPRDVAKFRGHLVELTTRLDGLTGLHGDHARTLLRESQDTSVKILEASCSLVRAEVDIFESLARKGWSGGGLDELLEKGTDLFAAEEAYGMVGGGGAGAGADEGATKLFSILPPKSILADAASDSGVLPLPGSGGGMMERGRSGAPPRGHTRADSLGVATEPYQSLAGAVTCSPERRGRGSAGGDVDAASIFSADFSPAGRPRMTRPFSPQPVRVRTEDVLGESDEDGSDDERKRRLRGSRRAGLGSDDESDEDGPSSPETVRDADGEVGGKGGLRATDMSLAMGGEDDEHPWDDERKRMSTAASDPDERERRWNTADDE